MKTKRDAFTQTYIECALWSSTDEDGEPLDRHYSIKDLSPRTRQQMEQDCRVFQEDNWDRISSDPARAGQDFWLTRNRHGAGFWEEADGKFLTDASHAFGEFNLYEYDNGLIGH